MVFFGPTIRRELVQPLGEPHVSFVRRDLKAGVGEGLELSAHRGHHARMAMPDVVHRDAAGEIDVAAALDVPDFRAGCVMGQDWNWHAHPGCGCDSGIAMLTDD